jgi:hypothetical protein
VLPESDVEKRLELSVPDCVLASPLSRLNAALPGGRSPPLPMRSGIATMAKAAKQQAPMARPTQGAHRQLSTLEVPMARIREES